MSLKEVVLQWQLASVAGDGEELQDLLSQLDLAEYGRQFLAPLLEEVRAQFKQSIEAVVSRASSLPTTIAKIQASRRHSDLLHLTIDFGGDPSPSQCAIISDLKQTDIVMLSADPVESGKLHLQAAQLAHS